MIKKSILFALAFCLAFAALNVFCAAQESLESAPAQESTQMPQGEMPQMPYQRGGMRGGRRMPNGEMPQMPQGNAPEMPAGSVPASPDATAPDNEIAPSDGAANEGITPPPGYDFHGEGDFGGQFDGENFSNPTQEVEIEAQEHNFFEEYFTPIISVILLALAFVFVIFYKRKNY